ncbi:Pleckstrin-like proteiny domain-containing family F member 1 [Nibea albiflora]|uniref:Pleckstrin-like proteiny domain-containing family F member 1 n=1 Tax=Nibea albiflora TaxID=240163 RepID=A0ACB7EWK0_NIBAL|nr:Pleckstrin-like proteiny domain-containing family F member 1 [Nibea albiflora]
MDRLTFDKENSERIKAVENSFGASGSPLSKPDRVLMGEGRLMKQGRRKPQPKVFFLFNDVLVYGSIILNGRWHKNQKIIRLEDIQLEDLEDGVEMRNQWLIRTPRKSFFVSAVYTRGEAGLDGPHRKLQRAVIDHIHPTKKLRVCRLCHKEDETSRLRGDSTGKNSSEEEDAAALSDEGEGGDVNQGYPQSSWLDTQLGTWGHSGIYDYPRPMHLRP